MKIKNAVVGNVVKTLTTGDEYKIIGVNKDIAGQVVSASLEEVLSEEEVEEGKVPVTLELGVEKFPSVFVSDYARDEAIPEGYSIVNGAITKDGVDDIVMGNIIADSIIKNFPGQIVFTAKDGDGLKVMSFIPSRDKFVELMSGMPANTEVIEDSDTRVTLVYSNTKEAEVPDENGEAVKKDVYDEAGVVVIAIDPELKTKATKARIDVLIDVNNVVISEDSRYLYIPTLDTEYEDGEKSSADDRDAYAVVRISNVPVLEEGIDLPEGLATVTKIIAADAREYGKTFMVGKNFLQVGRNSRTRVSANMGRLIDGKFMYLVSYENKDHVTTLTVANESLTPITVEVKHTTDRGDLVTIS